MPAKDPLQSWLWLDRRKAPAKARHYFEKPEQSPLDALEERLDSTPLRARVSYDRLGLYGPGCMGELRSETDVRRAESLCRRVMERGGAGATFAQETLLDVIGRACSPQSVPFWHEMLGLRRARDSFAAKRRILAISALGLLVIRENDPGALEAIKGALKDKKADVRALAAHYLGRVFLEAKRPVPDDVRAALGNLFANDAAIEPRFMARGALIDLGLPVPLHCPGGAFAFKVWHQRDRAAYRVIETASENTMDVLHMAIQRAWDWDADHLYSFFMSGRPYDHPYEISHPEVQGAVESAADAVIGGLGLRTGDTFIYLFDFGDDHLFKIEVAGVRPSAGPGKYPRVVKSVGKAMSQYGDFGG
jgi:hypothetical protein